MDGTHFGDGTPDQLADLESLEFKFHTLRKEEEILNKREELLLKEQDLYRKQKDLVQREEDLYKRQEQKFEKELASLEMPNCASKCNGKKVEDEKSITPAELCKTSFISLFKYADSFDILCMALGTVGAIVDGLALPLALYACSGLINSFGYGSASGTDLGKQFENTVRTYVLEFVYIAIGAWFGCFLEAACWMRTGDRQAGRLRSMYLRAILRQNEAFFDLAGANTAEVVNSVSSDTLVIQDAMSEKVGHFLMNMTTVLGGYAVAFYMSWKLALVLLAFSPLLVFPGIMYGKTLAGLAKTMHATTLDAGTVAEQAISSIRTVYSFVSEEKLRSKYADSLDVCVKLGLTMGIAKGLAVGSAGITFGIWALTSWYGSQLVIHDGVNGGKIICGGLALINGGMALGAALPNLKYFQEGRIAGHRIFSMIDRVPEIDSENMTGEVLQKVVGTMELRKVDFTYPARPETTIFKNMCLVIPAGKTLALVGGSGSGKSTVIALLERFYDPVAGEVLIDGVNVKNLQLKWLRTQIGLVSQEPALFATTIKENILFGKEGASDEEVIKAAKASNAHNFISGLPDLYDTQVGERGVQMSGGQKQRIAIARALLKNPPILLLDEATSALDAESEKLVQEALDSAAVGRTTVVVAHRLSTIRTAEIIAVVQGGQVVERGSHEELIRSGGSYSSLVQLQQSRGGDDDDDLRSADRNSFRKSSVRESFGLGKYTPRTTPRSTPRPSFSTPRQSVSKNQAATDIEVYPSMYLEEPIHVKPPSFTRLLLMNKPEWKQALLGSLGAIGFGIVQPLYAYVLGSTTSTFYLTDHAKMESQVRTYAYTFAGLAVACFLVNLLQHYNFAAMGEYLTKRIRDNMFAKVLTFEVGWFDRDENSSGAVCSRLASEANVVRSLVGDRISLVIQTIAAIVVAFAFGLVIAWKLALVMIAVQPIVILCYYAKKVLLKSMYNLTLQAQDQASQVASEAVGHHRTITAFSSQEKIMSLFDTMQLGPQKEAQRRAYIAGLGLGTAQCAMLCTWALDFWWGARLVSTGDISFSGLFKTFFILVASGRMIADAGSMTSDLAKGANSLVTVFDILDRQSRIDPDDAKGKKLEKVIGHVELRDIDFAYPMRPDILVFRNFNLKVRPGTSVALVGQSGSGKSTIIGLIERFYDPVRGKVKIDGHDLVSLHLRTIRAHIALVGQEPTLFAGSIRENITFGRENSTEAEVISAAKAANAYDFICSLEKGFETSTGERGVQLSGGQKQRIAIARAILKNPAILLLDEATSALDAQSEKVVQDALDRIMVGRTTIVVAHRLSTIQNCDTIAVIQDGCILEQGKHSELLGKGQGGAYFSLVQLQRREPVH